MAAIRDLRSLLGGSRPTRGVVVEVRAASVLVATPGGLREYAAASGLTVGDEVVIDSLGRVAKAAVPAQVYYV